jgi:biotin transporter BioY
VGYAVQRRRTLGWSFVAMTLGALVIFVGGTLQLRATLFGSWSDAFTAGFLIFSWWDVLKLSAASMIYHEVAKRWPQFS